MENRPKNKRASSLGKGASSLASESAPLMAETGILPMRTRDGREVVSVLGDPPILGKGSPLRPVGTCEFSIMAEAGAPPVKTWPGPQEASNLMTEARPSDPGGHWQPPHLTGWASTAAPALLWAEPTAVWQDLKSCTLGCSGSGYQEQLVWPAQTVAHQHHCRWH